MRTFFFRPVDGNTNDGTCLDVPENHLVGALVVLRQIQWDPFVESEAKRSMFQNNNNNSDDDNGDAVVLRLNESGKRDESDSRNDRRSR